MAKVETDLEREERIAMEVVVDCYNEDEENTAFLTVPGWHLSGFAVMSSRQDGPCFLRYSRT